MLAFGVFLYSALVPLKGLDVALGVIIGLALGWVIGVIVGYGQAIEERDRRGLDKTVKVMVIMEL